MYLTVEANLTNQEAYILETNPHAKYRELIGGLTRMTERSVQVWYQNRRQKLKNDAYYEENLEITERREAILAILEDQWLVNKVPTKSQLVSLTQATSISIDSLKIWFMKEVISEGEKDQMQRSRKRARSSENLENLAPPNTLEDKFSITRPHRNAAASSKPKLSIETSPPALQPYYESQSAYSSSSSYAPSPFEVSTPLSYSLTVHSLPPMFCANDETNSNNDHTPIFSQDIPLPYASQTHNHSPQFHEEYPTSTYGSYGNQPQTYYYPPYSGTWPNNSNYHDIYNDHFSRNMHPMNLSHSPIMHHSGYWEHQEAFQYYLPLPVLSEEEQKQVAEKEKREAEIEEQRAMKEIEDAEALKQLVAIDLAEFFNFESFEK